MQQGLNYSKYNNDIGKAWLIELRKILLNHFYIWIKAHTSCKRNDELK